MSVDFIFRMGGLIVCAILGARLGVDTAAWLSLPVDATGLLFSLAGALFGLTFAPMFTLRPMKNFWNYVIGASAQSLISSGVGLLCGLLAATMIAFPLSLINELLPAIAALLFGLAGALVGSRRSRDFWNLLNRPPTGEANASSVIKSNAEIIYEDKPILLDTSVIIDGRIADIAQTGFLFGVLIVPRFVLLELQHIADSQDSLRRNRGRRGLDILNQLQRESTSPVEIVDDDFPGTSDVDDKLVLLALQLNAPIMTNDYNLNQVAQVQGVQVLNINELANAVKAFYLPGESLTIHVIQEGKEQDQGVGFLDDGTMVVVEGGRHYIDRNLKVVVTKNLQTQAGRMIFARPI